MRCPSCSNKLLQKSGTHTRLRIRGIVEFDADGLCKAQCYWCRQDVTIPMVALRKSAVEEETFLIPLPPPKPAT
jgi:hypothetical protein